MKFLLLAATGTLTAAFSFAGDDGARIMPLTEVQQLDIDKFSLRTIQNDEVEYAMAYARTGDDIPSSMHGIFWMDQRGVHIEDLQDPSYKLVASRAANELLFSIPFGSYDPVSRCLPLVSMYGGPAGAVTWTFMNEDGNGHNDLWDTALAGRSRQLICFRDAKMDVIDVILLLSEESFLQYKQSMMKPAEAVSPAAAAALQAMQAEEYPSPPESDVKIIRLPQDFMEFTMVKTAWGWSRDSLFMRNFSNITYHYPVFQIVDGNGERTEHYDAYLAWANQNQDCPEGSNVTCAQNMGHGTSLIGVYNP